MLFTGSQKYLSLPRVSQILFEFRDIIVDSLGQYSFEAELIGNGLNSYSGYNKTGVLFTLSGGNVVGDRLRKISTYNTGKPFSLSGWLDTNNFSYIDADGILFPSTGTLNSGKLGSLKIGCPTSGTLICDISLNSQPVIYSFTIPNVVIHSSVTGLLETDTSILTYGTELIFRNSAVQLLTGNSFTGFNYEMSGSRIILADNDESDTDNVIKGNINVDALWGEVNLPFSTYRTIPSNNRTTITGLNEGALNFSGLFDGTWENNKFSYDSGQAHSILLNFRIQKRDPWGNPLSKTLQIYPNIGYIDTPLYRRYINTFTLTASGEYTEIPDLKVTGYYSVTGLEQTLNTILFSSGCTGDIGVKFMSPEADTYSSGNLITRATNISGIYGVGVQAFRTVDTFQPKATGYRYTQKPTLSVNTGQYGPQCFDVPLVSGDLGWYKPLSNGYGALIPMAAYLTGTVLCKTGMVGSPATITGYIVTGLDITNPGSGYGIQRYNEWGWKDYLPYVDFQRKAGDILTKNASGVFSLNYTGYNIISLWKVKTGIAGTTLANASFGPSIMYLSPLEEDISVEISCSGFDYDSVDGEKYPMTVQITDQQDGNTDYYDTAYYFNYWSTDPEFLKKKPNVEAIYEAGSDLSFLTTQSELDTLYSGTDFINEGNSLDLGDLNY